MVPYYDDLLILGSSQEEVESAIHVVRKRVEELGFTVSPKSQGAGERLTYLGFDVKLVGCAVLAAWPAAKAAFVADLVAGFLSAGRCSARDLRESRGDLLPFVRSLPSLGLSLALLIL
jgi:hypothetical protein